MSKEISPDYPCQEVKILKWSSGLRSSASKISASRGTPLPTGTSLENKAIPCATISEMGPLLKDTKVTGTLKAGAKVTVKYVMKATSIEAKEEAKKAEPKPKKK
jgi:hypothetical protein